MDTTDQKRLSCRCQFTKVLMNERKSLFWKLGPNNRRQVKRERQTDRHTHTHQTGNTQKIKNDSKHEYS